MSDHVCQKEKVFEDHERRLREVEDFKSSQSALWEFMRQDISEIKSDIKEWSRKQLEIYSKESSKPFWVPIVLELIKIIGIALAVIAGFSAIGPELIKILGK